VASIMLITLTVDGWCVLPVFLFLQGYYVQTMSGRGRTLPSGGGHCGSESKAHFEVCKALIRLPDVQTSGLIILIISEGALCTLAAS
jgi:hypothetical protein